MKLINPDHPPKRLDEDTQTKIAVLAKRQHRANGALMKVINYVGGQLEDTMGMLPKPARDQIDKSAKTALRKSYDMAATTRTGKFANMVKTDRMHKAAATVTGALGGLGGLPTAIAELPVATTMIFRAIQGVAESYGEDPTSEETRLNCLAVFGAGGPDSSDDGIDTAFIGARLGLTGATVHGLISKVAPRFATILTQKLASKAVPIFGAAAGAGTNYAFIDYYVEVAHVHFGLRALTREQDEAAVLEAFHDALASYTLPVKRA